MLGKLGVAVLGLLIFVADDCGSKSGGSSNQNRAGANVSAEKGDGREEKGLKDACALVERAEVEAVQQALVSDARPNSATRGPLFVSQCLYSATSSDRPGQNLGVLVEVRRADPKGADPNAVRDEWARLRGKGASKRSEGSRPVSGVGDDALWTGSDSKLGALYVLSKDTIIYISVGGPEDATGKIEKSKTLAEKALKRL